MYKDELIHLHQLLEFIMKFMTREGVSEEYFKKYLEAGIFSHHIYKTKEEHEYAVLLLSSELSNLLAKTYDDIPESVSQRFEKLAERAKNRRSKG
jgi:hypothetical protein